MTRLVTGVHGDVTKYFGLERNGKRTEHFRGYHQDCRPILNRVKQRAAQAPTRHEKKKEIGYIGSIPRSMLDDWLNARQKTWHDYATDSDLKKAFEMFMYAERPHFFLKAYST